MMLSSGGGAMSEAIIVPGWHPMVVHFPLALILTAVALLTAARVLRNPRWIAPLGTVGTWNLCLGALAIVVALATGLAATLDLSVSEIAHRAISSHVKSAMLSALIVLLLAVWRGAGGAPDSRPSWLFVILLWAAAAALVTTGFRGAQNVYRYGVGVTQDACIAHPAPPAGAPTTAAAGQPCSSPTPPP